MLPAAFAVMCRMLELEPAQAMPYRKTVISSPLGRLAMCSAAAAGVVLVLNALGLVFPMRAADVDGYRDFAGVETLDFGTAMRELDRLALTSENDVDLVTNATRLFHAGLAHVSPRDVEANGVEHYSMRVPATENWVLWSLSYLKPDTYRDYEFCSYKRALERGTGRCGQQSLALVSYLSEQGIETGFVSLEGHAVATARVDESRWYLLDADYGGVIPFDLAAARKDPESTLQHYWSDAARENSIYRLYGGKTEVKYGGPEARFARACPIERAAYAVKWLAPGFMLLPLPLLSVLRRRGGFETRAS